MILTVDIGGTKTLVVAFDDTGTIVASHKFATPLDYVQFVEELRQSKTNLNLSEAPAIGTVGTRGFIDRLTGTLIEDSILPWRNAALAAECKAVYGCDFMVENDSKLAGLAAVHAAGATDKKVVYVTISTGIGTAFVVNGQLDHNTIDSEVGKWRFTHDGTIQPWEEFASGSWIHRRFGKLASELDDEAAWQEVSHNLAIGFINICAAYTPDLIIIGGGVGAHLDKFHDSLVAAMQEMNPIAITIPPIAAAVNAEEAVNYGGYYFARAALAA